MAKRQRINIRIDDAIKDDATKVASLYGFSLSSLLNAFLIQIAQTGNIPLSLERKAKLSSKGPSGIVRYSKIASLLVDVASQYNGDQIKEVYLFGPYSRGEANSKTQIDFYLIPGMKMTQKLISEFETTLSNLLKRPVNVVASDDIISHDIRNSIDKEKVLLYKAKQLF
jgi:addiction module RelB/DinJ family antitoxin